MKLLSLFSGIGAFEKALENLNIEYDLINYCEIDKYAAKAYSLIHNTPQNKNLVDVKNINPTEIPDFDLLTWGFPCVNFSIAGKKEGMKFKCNHCNKIFRYDGKSFYKKLKNKDICPHCHSDDINSFNQSALYFEGYRILYHKKPKISILENVKRLVGTPEFVLILKDLEDLGYKTYYKILNAKDYGIPQNRERVFIVSIRKDICIDFEFPKGFDSGIRLNDIMSKDVNEKYFINQKLANDFISINKYTYLKNTKYNNFITKKHNDIQDVYYENNLKLLGGFANKNSYKGFSSKFRQGDRVYDSRNISTSLTSSGGGIGRNTGLYMATKNNSSKKTYKKYKIKKVSHKKYTLSNKNFIIRRLTPEEAFLLMGFSKKDYSLLNIFSDAQLYKMAGNSIVVNILENIFCNLYIA